jgi:hypothetical protein
MHFILMIQQAAQNPVTPDQLQQASFGFYGLGSILMISIAVLAVAGALHLLTMVVAPDLTARSCNALRQRSFLSFAAGGGIAIAMLLGGALCKALPVLGIPWALMATLLGTLGLAAASEDLGRRLFWTCGGEGNRATHILSGWAVMGLASSVPFLGWFVIAPYLVLSGVGSIVVGMVTARPPKSPSVDIEIR